MEAIHTNKAPAPGGHYSQAMLTANFIFTAGQVGLDPETGETPTDFREEARQCFRNLESVLTEGGAAKTDVVRTMCLLTDIQNFAIFNEEYEAFFGTHKPSRSTFAVGLAGSFSVEVEAIVWVGQESQHR